MPLSKEAKREYDLNRYYQRRTWLNKQKSKPCMDCGKSYPPYVMDFDHRSDKSFGVGVRLVSRKMEELIAEIAKCDVVCSNCHRERTYGVARLVGRATGL